MAAREEREQLAAKARTRREAQLAKPKAEREELMRAIRSRAPGFILDAHREFEREYRARGGAGMLGHETSSLVCFGCRVGMLTADRKAIGGRSLATRSPQTLTRHCLFSPPRTSKYEEGRPVAHGSSG